MNALVVYRIPNRQVRATLRDHLYSFRRYSGQRYAYLNLSVRGVPRAFARASWDAVIFHTSFLSGRWTDEGLEPMRRKALPLKGAGRVRIALPQDEYMRTDQLCAFIEEFEIDHVCSVAPESEWPKIYAGVDRDRVSFSQVLTGYLDSETQARIERLRQPLDQRALDIGYRARRLAPWIGRHGVLKWKLAEAFGSEGRRRGLAVDLSTDPGDVLLGDDWYHFLSSCKYTVGVEGGASLLDPDGSTMKRTDAYLEAHPDASFDEVEQACFPGRDGELALFALGPRHLEACATRTCQILVEGSYNGILRPGEHYIELRADLSNLGHVLDEVACDENRKRLVEAAYRDVVASGAVSYERFVAEVERALPSTQPAPASALRWRAIGAFARLLDAASWVDIALSERYRNLMGSAYPAARERLPAPVFRLLQRLRGLVVRVVPQRKVR